MARTTQFANSALGAGKPSNALYGSNLMVEMLRELGILYIALNPGASFRGLHDSLVNFGEGGPEIPCVPTKSSRWPWLTAMPG